MQRSIIAPAERVTNLRWGIALLLGFGVLIGALDRANLMVSSSAFYHGIAVMTVGYALLAFGVAYAIAQIVAGLLLDRYGVTLLGRIASVCAAVFGLLPALVGSFGTFFAARAVFGLDKTLAYPMSVKATGYWFPIAERGLATSIFDVAAKLATAVAIPLLTLILAGYGWRATFLLTGGLSALFCAAFFLFYRDPGADQRLTHAEREHIKTGGAQPEGPPANGSVVRTFFYLLTQRKVWGLTIGFAAYSFAFFVLIMWLPEWLARSTSMPVLARGLYAAIPWLCAAIADVLAGGLLVDALIRRGLDATRVRKAILIAGMVLGLSMYGALTTHDPNAVVAYLSVALAGLGMSAPVIWSTVSLIAPRGAAGSLGSILTFAGAITTFAAVMVAGNAYALTSNVTNVFVIAAAVLILGILSYVFLLGRIEPIAEPATII